MEETKASKGAAATQPALNKKEDFILKYKNWIIGGVIAVIVAIVGVVLYKNHKSAQQEKAATASAVGQNIYLNDGIDYYINGNTQGDSTAIQKALNGDGKGFIGFVKIADEYSSTPAGNLANLYAGLSYAAIDKWQEAAQYIEKFEDAGDIAISPAAMGALANCYANLNQLDKAVETFKKAAERAANAAQSPMFLVEAGLILESQGKKADALKLYEQVKTYERIDRQIPYQDVIDEYIERVSQ
ncbi:MAG: tetratricopeptide repeat protein [Prevotella sp.]|nr:tetratricopeptide repeat protein [Prevotella sp.]